MEPVQKQRAPSTQEGGRWAERLVELGIAYERAQEVDERNALLSEIWLLLHAALGKYLRLHGSGRFDVEELRDIASAKCLDLLRKLHDGRWNPSSHHPAQLCTFLATLARNGLVDLQRARDRRDRVVADPGHRSLPRVALPTDGVLREAVVVAIRECASRLSPRARTVWLFRVLYEMPTRAIASHPEVEMAPGAVDVMLARCRIRIHNCMKEKKLDLRELPPGTFAALWEAFRAKLSAEP